MGRPPNEADFVGLYAQHQSDLFRYVAALVPHLQDAEDVLSEVTVMLWKNFGDFEQGTNFLAWARQIAYLRVLKYYRARNRRLVLPQRLLEKLASDLTFRDEVTDQRLTYLAECKKELSVPDVQLVEERYVQRRKVQDLARWLAQSENSVSKSLGRIRRMLLACIERKMASENRAGRFDDRKNVGDRHG
jgi:RNA polymerase sigma-70 factor (ECF subfamily)